MSNRSDAGVRKVDIPNVDDDIPPPFLTNASSGGNISADGGYSITVEFDHARRSLLRRKSVFLEFAAAMEFIQGKQVTQPLIWSFPLRHKIQIVASSSYSFPLTVAEISTFLYLIVYQMGEQNLFAECKAILYHDDSVPVGTLEIRSAATTPTSPTFVVNDTEASDTSAIQMETAKRSYPGNITLSEDARKWRFAVQKPPFRIEEWRLMTGLIAAAQYTLTLEQARFQSFVWDDDGRNLDLLLQSTLKFEDADKRALTQLTILKTISAIIEEEYSLAIKNREFRVVNFKIMWLGIVIATGEFSLHDAVESLQIS